jgi:uncharacterized membrane protein YhaH (DUF805 family)
MACLIVLVAMFAPRVTLFFIFLLTDWFGQAYQTVIWPLLGFIFMPLTTLAYMAAMLNNDHQLSGLWIVLMVVAVIADLTTHGGSASSRRRRRVYQ